MNLASNIWQMKYTQEQLNAHRARMDRQARMKPQPRVDPPSMATPAPVVVAQNPPPKPVPMVADQIFYFSPMLAKGQWGRKRVQRALRLICHIHKIAPHHLFSVRRTQRFIAPRHHFMWLCYRYTNWSCVQIGKFCGNRDHTTVLHAVRKIENLYPHRQYRKLSSTGSARQGRSEAAQ